MDPLVGAVVGGTIFHKSFQIPLQKTSMDIMTSAFRMPGIMRMFVLSGAPMMWVDFLYHFVVDLIYRAVRAAYKPGVRPESVFYATIYDFEEQFKQVVTANVHKGCVGLSLAMGYTNPWARIIRTQCDAWASVPSGMLQFINVFLVDIPMAKCLCKDAQGNNFHRYATDVCLANTPDSIKPTVQAMIDAQDLQIKSACTLVVRYTTTQMQDSFQTFFDNQFECSSNIGSSLDYMLRIGTQRSPQDDLCTNFQTNPYVTLIIPEPVDYFRPCGQTSVCRSRCRAEIEAFEAANTNPSVITQPYTTRSNTPFFLKVDEGSVTPMTIIATTELTDCEYVCGKRASQAHPDKCVAIAGVVGDSDLTVMLYCIPTMPGVGVRKDDSKVWIAKGTLPLMNKVIDIMFLDYRRGEGLVLISENKNREGGYDTPMKTRLDIIWKGDKEWVDGWMEPAISEESMLNAISNKPANTRIQIKQITGIQVSFP